jgi:hypothetical protein
MSLGQTGIHTSRRRSRLHMSYVLLLWARPFVRLVEKGNNDASLRIQY